MIEYENLKKVNAKFFDEFKSQASKVIESGWYILGKNVESFEHNFAKYIGRKYCIGVASGLDALTLSIRALDLKPYSEIIVPSNTYIATILSIINAGMKPVLVEPDINTYNIDPGKIVEKISNKTVAIMVVHLYGKSADMNPIMEIKEKYGLKLFEDCAQSHGAKYYGRMTGSFGELSSFSFYPTKNLGALGDGGAVLTDDKFLANKVRTLRNYGSGIKYHNDLLGVNSRLDEIQAAFLNVKLKYLDEINNHKRKLAKLYLDNLNDTYIKPVVNDNFYDVYHIFNIRTDKRDELKNYLLNNNIKTEIHYPVSPAQQKALRPFKLGNSPISDKIHKTTLSLPVSYGTTPEEVHKVTEVLNNFNI
jgi:dTDP-4-amino-4,6-dideoxygalactose transaminase